MQHSYATQLGSPGTFGLVRGRNALALTGLIRAPLSAPAAGVDWITARMDRMRRTRGAICTAALASTAVIKYPHLPTKPPSTAGPMKGWQCRNCARRPARTASLEDGRPVHIARQSVSESTGQWCAHSNPTFTPLLFEIIVAATHSSKVHDGVATRANAQQRRVRLQRNGCTSASDAGSARRDTTLVDRARGPGGDTRSF